MIADHTVDSSTMPAPPARKPATLEDLAMIEDRDRLELITGVVVEKLVTSIEHSFATARLISFLDGFNRRPGPRGPGGWWLGPEVHVGYSNGDVFCHDAAGWRRERSPERPTGWPAKLRPDWVCEIVSPRHERRDYVTKPSVLHVAEVPHYWLIHPEQKMLLVHRWTPAGYTIVMRTTSGDRVRAEPFEAIELDVAELFGDEVDE